MLLLSIVAASSLSDRACRIKLFPSINNSSCYSNDRIVAHNLPTFAHNLTPLPIPKCSHTCVLMLIMCLLHFKIRYDSMLFSKYNAKDGRIAS